MTITTHRSILRFTRMLAFGAIIIAANITLSRPLQAGCGAGDGGYGGAYNEPYEDGTCTGNQPCYAAECNCGTGDFVDHACPDQGLCGGQCGGR
jgi:hypothetical protein